MTRARLAEAADAQAQGKADIVVSSERARRAANEYAAKMGWPKPYPELLGLV